MPRQDTSISPPPPSGGVFASPPSGGWRHPLWLALLVAASVVFSLGLACATPLAALAGAAALSLPRREALGLVAAAWLANQLVGYGFLGYPWTADSLAWGAALGIAAVLACEAARSVATHGRLPAGIAAAAAFAAAFITFEAGLLAVALAFLGGVENFTPAIVGEILIINATAFVGLLLLNRVATALGWSRPAPRVFGSLSAATK